MKPYKVKSSVSRKPLSNLSTRHKNRVKSEIRHHLRLQNSSKHNLVSSSVPNFVSSNVPISDDNRDVPGSSSAVSNCITSSMPIPDNHEVQNLSPADGDFFY